MYIPPVNRITDDQDIRDFVRQVRSAWMVTTGPDGVPVATLLPIIWRDDTVIAHMAIANDHWRALTSDMPVLLIVSGPEAYVSPSWYASKTEHGRVVPTWNYLAVHLTGTARVERDPQWLRNAVVELTDHHESERENRWHVTDAPDEFVTAQLGGIVGITVAVTGVEAKAKLSQNRSDADKLGVVDGLAAEAHPGASEVAAAMTACHRDSARGW